MHVDVNDDHESQKTTRRCDGQVRRQGFVPLKHEGNHSPIDREARPNVALPAGCRLCPTLATQTLNLPHSCTFLDYSCLLSLIFALWFCSQARLSTPQRLPPIATKKQPRFLRLPLLTELQSASQPFIAAPSPLPRPAPLLLLVPLTDRTIASHLRPHRYLAPCNPSQELTTFLQSQPAPSLPRYHPQPSGSR